MMLWESGHPEYTCRFSWAISEMHLWFDPDAGSNVFRIRLQVQAAFSGSHGIASIHGLRAASVDFAVPIFTGWGEESSTRADESYYTQGQRDLQFCNTLWAAADNPHLTKDYIKPFDDGSWRPWFAMLWVRFWRPGLASPLCWVHIEAQSHYPSHSTCTSAQAEGLNVKGASTYK